MFVCCSWWPMTDQYCSRWPMIKTTDLRCRLVQGLVDIFHKVYIQYINRNLSEHYREHYIRARLVNKQLVSCAALSLFCAVDWTFDRCLQAVWSVFWKITSPISPYLKLRVMGNQSIHSTTGPELFVLPSLHGAWPPVISPHLGFK